MNNLEKKYRTDKLTLEELLVLRERINGMEDAEIEQYLYNSWLDNNIDTSTVDDELITNIKKNVDETIGKKRPQLSLFIRWTQIAAAILLPVFIILTVYLYKENSLILTDEMIVSTGQAESATITLPDGTVVSLNSQSKLGYLPKAYNKKERKINFSGEGYFVVHKNKDVPFLINAKGLEVKVLGTTFNLSVRHEDSTAILSLEEGSISLLSIQSNKNVTLEKNQIAILDHATGNIIVIYNENVKDKSAWRRGDMVFRNTELVDVIRSIEEQYNVTIKIDYDKCINDAFTGIIPRNDLNEALEIIENSYHLKAIITGKEIFMR